MKVSVARYKLRERLAELRVICRRESPWSFVCIAVFLDHLAHLVGQDYKGFITKWMSQVRPGYRTFAYKKSRTTLAVQMYHVLRCGLVHALSMVPDAQGHGVGGRAKSIVLSHRKESKERKLYHLSNYCMPQVEDAAWFVAEDLVDDIEQVVELIFERAKKDANLKARMNAWLKENPLVTGDY